jgi:hypothetical protein
MNCMRRITDGRISISWVILEQSAKSVAVSETIRCWGSTRLDTGRSLSGQR